jgi:hypothetical protein
MEVAQNASSVDYKNTTFLQMADFTEIIDKDLQKLQGLVPELARIIGIKAVHLFRESFVLLD